MPKGKDPETADHLGGVHKVTIPRQPVRAPGDEVDPRPEPRDPSSVLEPEPSPRDPISGADSARP